MTTYRHDTLTCGRHGYSRRSFLRQISAASALGTLGFQDLVALQADELRRAGRSLIVLWMAGGPTQFETFDPKPAHANGGGTAVISTAVPGIQVAEHWTRTAQMMRDIAIIRSMTNKEGNHQRATYQLHTGYVPSGSVKHPSLGSCIAQQIATPDADLPSVVSIGPTQGAGFLGVDYEPFNIDAPGDPPRNLTRQVTDARLQRRLGLMDRLEGEFAARGAQAAVNNHRQLYDKASKLVLSPDTSVFSFSDESPDVRARYGNSQFGKGCLLARRLVEAGVTYVEVRSNGWDTHQDNFEKIGELAGDVDPASAALLEDLKSRGLLERCLVLWMGEFGRTPKVNPRGGRDHYPRVFNMWAAGAGVRGGQVIGASTPDGSAVQDRPVTVPDLFTSVCRALQVNPRHENLSPLGRPLKIVDGGQVIEELFG